MLGKSVNVLLQVSEINKKCVKKNIDRYIGISDFKTNKYLYRPSKSFISRALVRMVNL